MDTAQWPQEIVMKPMEEIVQNTCSKPSLERKIIRPQKEQALNCPRCNSTNTKFCYYNNYSLSQPRYFCKTCRRYWTEGGSLRSIPVGGGSRKNKRPSSSSSSNSSSSTSSKINKLPDLVPPPPNNSHSSSQNPKIHETQDLNLGFPSTHDFKTISELIQVPNHMNSSNSSSPSTHLSAMELLTGMSSSRGLNNSFINPMPGNSDPNMIYSSGFSFQEFKPTLNFSLDHGLGSLQGVGETSGRLLFPFEDLKQVSTTSGIEQNRDHHNHQHQQGDSNGFNWNGMLGGGGGSGGSW